MNDQQAEISSLRGPIESPSRRRASVLLTAQFNPRIKSYLILLTTLILAVTVFGIALIPLWLIFGPIYVARFYRTLHCELTTRALHFKKGVWFHVERTIPLDKIQDLTFKEGPLLRYLGLSILKIETAGQTGQGGADLSLIGIVDAHQFRERVLDQRDEVTEGAGSETPKEGETGGVIPLLEEIRDLLRSMKDLR